MNERGKNNFPQKSDRFVSVESQTGGMSVSARSIFSAIFRYYHFENPQDDIADRVIELLNVDSEGVLFNNGFAKE